MVTNNYLNKMGLAPLSAIEMQEVDGGNIFTTIGNAISDAANAVAGAATAVGDYVSCLYDNMNIVVFGITIKEGCSCSCS